MVASVRSHRSLDRARRRRWAPVGLVAGVIWALSIVPGGSLPTAPGTDLLGHALEFALLGLLVARASVARSRAMIALAVGLGLGVGTELSQLLAVARTAQLADLAADLLGTLLGVAIWASVVRRSPDRAHTRSRPR